MSIYDVIGNLRAKQGGRSFSGSFRNVSRRGKDSRGLAVGTASVRSQAAYIANQIKRFGLQGKNRNLELNSIRDSRARFRRGNSNGLW